jgi:hypothetical protein
VYGRGDNIKMDLEGIGWEGLNWIHLADDRDRWRILENTAMNLQFHNRWRI